MDATSVLVGFVFGVIWDVARVALFSPREQRQPRLVKLDMVAPIPAPADPALDDQWRMKLTQFAFAGNMLGFGLRQLSGAGVVTRPAWTTYIGLMRRAGVLQVEERASSVWSCGWNYPAFRMALKHGRLVIPYPARRPPAVYLGGKPAQMTQAGAAQHSGTGSYE